MPVVRERMSVSQFAEMLGIEPERFIDAEVDLRYRRVTLVLQPADRQAEDDTATPWKVT